MTLETSKNLGGVGALLIFLGPLLTALPTVGGWTGILSLIGVILVLIALKGFADYYKEVGIFNNALYAVIAVIVGVVVVAAVAIFAFVDLFAALGLQIGNFQDWASIGTIFSEMTNFDVLFSFIGTLLIALAVAFVFLVITAFLLRRSLSIMATKTNVGLFGTTGLLLLIGAVLVIIAIGIFLVWISMLLLAIAFFSVRTQTMPPPAATTGTPAPV